MPTKPTRPSAAAITAAHGLRHALSFPEKLLWRYLRSSPQGVKVRRQHPVGDYILDFYIAPLRLAIEIDGAGHRASDRGLRDERRDAWCAQHGIETMRISASDVLADPVGVAEGIIVYALAKRGQRMV